MLLFPDMMLIFIARLLDESFAALGSALLSRCARSVEGTLDACDRLARSRRRRRLAGYPPRLLALREMTSTTAMAHG